MSRVDIDFGQLPGAHKNMALVPQWDFLEMLATAAEAEPSFRLLRSTEVVGVLRDADRVDRSDISRRQTARPGRCAPR